MKINEVSTMTGISKRAIKYYEAKGLLQIHKQDNSYRSYTIEDIERLKEIACYRKLEIALPEIQQMLQYPNQKTEILKKIHAQKLLDQKAEEQRLAQLNVLIQKECSLEARISLEEALDYKTIAQAFQDMLPGALVQYFMLHFLPYLQIPMTSPQQKEAYQKILVFLDELELKSTLLMRCSSFLLERTHLHTPQMMQMIDQQIQDLLDPDDKQYEIYKQKFLKQVQQRSRWIHRWNPFTISRRRFMKRLQDCGYYDLLIPNMKQLSPLYKDYHDDLIKLNDRICQDTGIHYDSQYHMVIG